MLNVVIDAATAQHAADDLNCRWTLGGDSDDFNLADYDDEPKKLWRR